MTGPSRTGDGWRSRLRRYHDQLLSHGIDGYPRDQLWTDYRLMIPMGVYIAVEYNRGGLHADLPFVWLRYLQRTLTACDDLDCAALWSAHQSA